MTLISGDWSARESARATSVNDREDRRFLLFSTKNNFANRFGREMRHRRQRMHRQFVRQALVDQFVLRKVENATTNDDDDDVNNKDDSNDTAASESKTDDEPGLLDFRIALWADDRWSPSRAPC